MKPSASAPKATASRASASDVMPQILTNTSTARDTGRCRRRDGRAATGCPRRAATAAAAVARADQRLADQHGRYPAAPSRAASSGVARCRTRRPPPRRPGCAAPSRSARSPSTSKVCRSRWFTPTSDAPAPAPARARPRRAPRPGRPARARPATAEKSASSSSLSAATIKSTASAPIEPGVVDVGDAHGEVLAQHRQRRGRPGRRQVLGRAAEVVPVGQDRQAGGAARPRSRGRCRPGRGPASRSPFDGERRLTSAMTASPARAGGRRAAANPRAGGPVGGAAHRNSRTSRSSAAAASVGGHDVGEVAPMARS